jgi:RNA polymerase-binding protein DksA
VQTAARQRAVDATTHPRQESNVKGKTEKLTSRELQKFKRLLLARRKELLSNSDDDGGDPAAIRGSMSNVPTHLADRASDSFDQDMRLRLKEQHERELMEIDWALQRITEGTYGVCEITGKAIEKRRLNAIPWTPYSLEGQEIIEREGIPASRRPKPIWREPVNTALDSDDGDEE